MHEIEAHAIPRTRAAQARIAIFQIGTARGIDDQEGLALVLEERLGFLTPRRKRELAARHLAVEAMDGGARFTDNVHGLVKEHGLTPREAVLVAERAYRGGDGTSPGLGRERIYLDRFWNEVSATPKAIDEATRNHYAALYARPGAMHSAFEQFAAFSQDAIDNKALAARGKLAMPVLAMGGEKSFGPIMATVMRSAASDVTEGVIPDSGHWIMEENPRDTIAMVRAFLASK
jgi:pimeloyl-ACP methyl ester carboxylesterase